MSILEELIIRKDDQYADFQANLTPTVGKESILGIRVPEIRKLAKQYKNTQEAYEFMKELPHRYYDENMLHGLLINEIKDYNECIEKLEIFLPYIDNWAVCDITNPKVFKKHKAELLIKILEWIKSEYVYTCRFAIGTLMGYFLDEDFQKEYLELPCKVHSEEYYINMMIAWYYATALAKQWDATIVYLENNQLDFWVHNKTIQKARESSRITPEQKEYLKSLKRSK